MAGDRPVLGLGRTFADEDLRGHEPLAAATGSGPGDPQRPPGSQARDKLPAQRTPTLDVEGLVDGLVGDPHGHIIGEVDPEPVRDLLRDSTLSPSVDPPCGHDVGR
jgi:hypothetical protein